MSLIVNNCNEQYLSIEQLLRLAIYCNEDGNKYLNTCDSGLNPDDLLQLRCSEQYPIKGTLKNAVGEDDNGNPCVFFLTTDNPSICSNMLDFEFCCNSQYLILI